jgi:2-deoxy-D-gluconate 3-dehydrogenase
MDLQLAGLGAVVTGASGALGGAIAAALAEEGANVLGVGRDRRRLERLGAHPSGRVQTLRCDVRNQEALGQVPGETIRRIGRLDIIVNNAGVVVPGAFHEQPQSLWDDHLAVNLTAAVVLTRAAAPELLRQGSGKVINMVSSAALQAPHHLTAYAASKAALLQFTRALAIEWAGRGVQVNAIAPGGFESNLQPADLQFPGPALEARLARIPDRRFGLPHELAPIACFLASPLSAHVTGAVYVIDGGETVRL